MSTQSRSIPVAVVIAAGHARASSGAAVSPAQFVAALTGGSGQAADAVEAYLNEADPAELADLVACGATSFEALARLAARLLPAVHPNRVWLDELVA